MYDPCAHCPCILQQEICRNFCTVYKAAVKEDTRKGLIEYGQSVHDRILRTLK